MAIQLKDGDSIPSSTTMEDEKVMREEGEMANAGDIEAGRQRSEDKKLDAEVEPEDPYMVKWNGTDDPDNPLNFPTRRKVLVMVMIAAIAFLTYVAMLFCRSSPRLDLLLLQCFRPRYPKSWQSSIRRTKSWVHFQSRCLFLAMRLDPCLLSFLKCRTN
jgi:hypothetical protein